MNSGCGIYHEKTKSDAEKMAGFECQKQTEGVYLMLVDTIVAAEPNRFKDATRLPVRRLSLKQP